ncbi:hypothetical protein TNCV_1555571 [Trichonephila clavipes]|nr:hypothetical protein TNCV_1555571 [Trichonephila clavipes]
MYSLQEIRLLKLASTFHNDHKLRKLMQKEEYVTRERLIREKLPLPVHLQNKLVAWKRKRKLDGSGASEINRLYPESRKKG